ncbi:nickel-dependent lactate racemase [Alkalihalobacillus oceani]|uniref:lactate racemase domain-containing protein n=1 Tax=Halalkalibacter oceani TaxID=1653776 RepID=UPI00203F53BB|nr:lactate racemase domain-containing protein [Halalkalibacter oceani]MCM3762710.1 nickel-dependent lactate racemase [Halalkalibacter oceani]
MMEMYEIRQKFRDDKLADISGTIQRELMNNSALAALPKGAEVAITAGSRGIANIVLILRETVSTLKSLGYRPFLVPAMGSHGGATADGQVEVLHHLGITAESVGAEIRSSMEVEQIAKTADGVPVYMDTHAYGADGVIVINRIKAHTAFRGRVESGLSKMVTIGLGKRKGASFVHANGALHMARNIETVCASALRHSPIVMGLAIIENGYDQTADIVGVGTEEWFEVEAGLLKRAKEMMPRLPVDTIDVLIVEEMGKIFSGTGMDPNIIGRWRIEGVPEPEKPDVKRIVVLDLTEQSFGNAQGVGLADFTTQRLVDRIDRKATYTNSITSTYLQRAMLPFIYDDERESIESACDSLGPEVDLTRVRLVQVPNTLHLDHLLVSRPVLEQMERSAVQFEIEAKRQLRFDTYGSLAYKLTSA